MVAGGFQVGDPNFTHYASIRADKAEAFRVDVLPHGLRDETLAVAERLGYDPKTLTNERPAPVAASPPAGAARDSNVSVIDTAMGGIDLERDAALPPSFEPNAKGPRWSAAPRSILLTGATGFLGAFLLDALLHHTDAIIHCLVRPADEVRAWQRLRGNQERYGLWREEDRGRMRPVPGDVSTPGLGMPAARHASLCQEVDVVLHAAAQMSWRRPYRDLFASNVEGTRELLQFAAESQGASCTTSRPSARP